MVDSIYNRPSEPYKLVRVDRYNFSMFDDMIFKRRFGRERTNIEKTRARLRGFRECYIALANTSVYIYAALAEDKMIGLVSFAHIQALTAPPESIDAGRRPNGMLYVTDLWADPDGGYPELTEKLLGIGRELSGDLEAETLRVYISPERAADAEIYKAAGFREVRPEMLYEK